MIVCAVAILIVGIGRAHDMGRSGWVALLLFVPIAGIVALFWLGFSKSEE